MHFDGLRKTTLTRSSDRNCDGEANMEKAMKHYYFLLMSIYNIIFSNKSKF